MYRAEVNAVPATLVHGVQLACADAASLQRCCQGLSELLSGYALAEQTLCIPVQTSQGPRLECTLRPEVLAAWLPGHDSLELQSHLRQAPPFDERHALEREILVAMLASPTGFVFPGTAALASAIRVRRNIAEAARKTALAFKTAAAERPAAYWHYDEDHGFLLQPGRCLIEALVSATQPDASGRLYDFSCYRATEYVILLGIAMEAKEHHPALLARLQAIHQVHAIRSGQFHEVFLVEDGRMDEPLPPRYYVPGDRVWFRNPDEPSSNVTGYEGSWVIYLGQGQFSNFWQRERPYTLDAKCLEIFHWRDGVCTDAQGELQMDEACVERHCRHTRQDPQRTRAVLQQMLRLRDPQGVYAEGGCIDTTREPPRGVSLDDDELPLPHFAAHP